MKRSIITVVCAAMLLSGCDTYTGAGAYTGAALGSVLGSAIGGLAGGPRGSDLGTLVGMAGGAAVGASVGSAAEAKAARKRQDDVYRYKRDKAARKYRSSKKQLKREYYQQESDTYPQGEVEYDNSQAGDDRVYDIGIAGPNDR